MYVLFIKICLTSWSAGKRNCSFHSFLPDGAIKANCSPFPQVEAGETTLVSELLLSSHRVK